MKVVQLRNGLLFKHLTTCLFAILISSFSYGSDLPKIEASIYSLNFVGMDDASNAIYNANMEIDIDVSSISAPQNINELGFDLELLGVNSGSFVISDLTFCSLESSYNIVQNIFNPNIFHTTVQFENGIDLENDCSLFALATVNIIVESLLPFPPLEGFSKTSDCYDNFVNTVTTSINISNSYMVISQKTLGLESQFFSKDFGTNGCEIPEIEDERQFDTNIGVGIYADNTIRVDVYFRYSEGEEISLIEKGIIHVACGNATINSPTFIASHLLGPSVNFTTNGAISTINFNSASISHKALTQIYVGTIIYEVNDPQLLSNVGIAATGEVFLDQFGPLTYYGNSMLHDLEMITNTDLDNSSKYGKPLLEEENILSAYPIPAKNYVIMKTNFDLEKSTKIEVFDVAGNKIDLVNFNFINGKEIRLNIENLSKGIYFVTLANDLLHKNLKILKQ